MAAAISLKPSPIGDFETQRGGTESIPTWFFTLATPKVVLNAAKHARSFPLSPANAQRERAIPGSTPKRDASKRTVPVALSSPSNVAWR